MAFKFQERTEKIPFGEEAQHEKHVLDNELTTYSTVAISQYGRQPYRKTVCAMKLA
jgi:hypothetical protein